MEETTDTIRGRNKKKQYEAAALLVKLKNIKQINEVYLIRFFTNSLIKFRFKLFKGHLLVSSVINNNYYYYKLQKHL